MSPVLAQQRRGLLARYTSCQVIGLATCVDERETLDFHLPDAASFRMAVATVNATAPTAANGPQADPDTSMADAPTVPAKVHRFKASELPLPSATRSAIEDLAHAFKKKGGYDETRKSVWEKFEASVRVLSSPLPQPYKLQIVARIALLILFFPYRNIVIRFTSPSSRSPKRKSNEIPLNS